MILNLMLKKAKIKNPKTGGNLIGLQIEKEITVWDN